MPRWEEQRAKLETCRITLDGTKMAINSLKNWKAPGTDGIPAELLKYGCEVMYKNIHELCLIIWKASRD
jgi:hypothetical protein